jgi:hypothetical protein
MKHFFRSLPDLERLLDRELQCARTLDMTGLRQVLRERAALLADLSPAGIAEADAATRRKVDDMRRRVRRLESLYRSARRTLLALGALHSRRSGLPGYGSGGEQRAGTPARPMLSGRV